MTLTEPARRGTRPLLRWAGGKSSIAMTVIRRFPASYSRYLEPFLGGGAIFFQMAKVPHIIGNDLNKGLIETYEVIRDNPDRFIGELRKHRNEKSYFLEVRAWDRDRAFFEGLDPVVRAARFFFLNKTCFNGLYRENSKGEFNVPFAGLTNPALVPEQKIREASHFLRGTSNHKVELTFGTYETLLERCEKNDFVYLDPPYFPISATSSFVAYQAGGFDSNNLTQLRTALENLNQSGTRFLLSNSDSQKVWDIFGGDQGFLIERISAPRNVGASAASRGSVPELLISNYRTDA